MSYGRFCRASWRRGVCISGDQPTLSSILFAVFFETWRSFLPRVCHRPLNFGSGTACAVSQYGESHLPRGGAERRENEISVPTFKVQTQGCLLVFARKSRCRKTVPRPKFHDRV